MTNLDPAPHAPHGEHDAAHDAAVHRALSSPARSRLLAHLRSAEAPVGIAELAQGLDLHVNTVRSHLGVLEEAGLVASAPESRDRPGRPRLTYRATPQGEEIGAGTDDGYRFLAVVLASYLSATSPDPSAQAEEAGQAWGRYVVDRPAPFQQTDPEDGLARVTALLEELGFAPELDTADPTAPKVRLHRCPFLDVAKEHQDVVCAVHLGLIRGALDELGAQVEARALHPFVAPGLCVADLEVGP